MTTLSLTYEPNDLGPVKTSISDDDLQVVSAFTGLRHLDLRQTNITDAGLVHLGLSPYPPSPERKVAPADYSRFHTSSNREF